MTKTNKKIHFNYGFIYLLKIESDRPIPSAELSFIAADFFHKKYNKPIQQGSSRTFENGIHYSIFNYLYGDNDYNYTTRSVMIKRRTNAIERRVPVLIIMGVPKAFSSRFKRTDDVMDIVHTLEIPEGNEYGNYIDKGYDKIRGSVNIDELRGEAVDLETIPYTLTQTIDKDTSLSVKSYLYEPLNIQAESIDEFLVKLQSAFKSKK